MNPTLKTLGAFVRSWVHPETVLGYRIRTLLIFKLAVLLVLKFAFFSGGVAPVGTDVADRFIGSDPHGGRTIVHD